MNIEKMFVFCKSGDAPEREAEDSNIDGKGEEEIRFCPIADQQERPNDGMEAPKMGFAQFARK